MRLTCTGSDIIRCVHTTKQISGLGPVVTPHCHGVAGCVYTRPLSGSSSLTSSIARPIRLELSNRVHMDSTLWLRGFTGEGRTSQVLAVTLAGTPVNPADPDSVLHWIVYCDIGSGRAIAFDMLPGCGPDGMTGCLQVVVCDAPAAQDLSASFTANTAASASLSGQEVLDSLLENPRRRNRYMYDETGSGCRFWCRTVLEDLERAEIVPSGSLEQFDEYLFRKSEVNPARFPMPTRRGRFY